MAPGKKPTTNDAAPQDSTFKHDFKELAKRVDMMSTQDQILRGHGVRLDEQGRRQDEQGGAIVEHGEKLGAQASELTNLKEEIQKLSREVKGSQAASESKPNGPIQTSVNQEPMMMISMRNWDDINVRSRTMQLVVSALNGEEENLKFIGEIPPPYRPEVEELIKEIKNLLAERGKSRAYHLEWQKAEKQAISDKNHMQKVHKILSQDNDHLQASLNHLGDDFRALEDRETGLRMQLNERHEAVNELEEDKRSLLSESSRLQKALKDAEAESHFLTGKIKVVQDTANTYEGQLKAMARELMMLREELAELEEGD